MKVISVFGALILCLSGVADVLPTYIGDVHGLIMTALTTREAFDFHSGKVGNCVRKEAGKIVSYNCEINDASSQVVGASTISVVYKKLVVFYETINSGDVRQRFSLTGTWSEKTPKVVLQSAVRLELWNLKSKPQNIRGSFVLFDYALTGSIQASQE